MYALPGRVSKVLHCAYPIPFADQQAPHGRVAVHRFHGDGRKALCTGPGFLAFQRALRQACLAVRGQHTAQSAIQGAIVGAIAQLAAHGLAARFRDQRQRAGGQPALQLRQVPGRITRPLAPAAG